MTALSVTSALAAPHGRASKASVANSFDVIRIVNPLIVGPVAFVVPVTFRECYRAAPGSPSCFGRPDQAPSGAAGAKWRGVRQPQSAGDVRLNAARSHCRHALPG